MQRHGANWQLELEASYATATDHPSRFNHNQYRKRVQQHMKIGTHAIRRCAITEVANADGCDAAMDFAGHIDRRMTARYVKPNETRTRNIVRARAMQGDPHV
jgi:integrase